MNYQVFFDIIDVGDLKMNKKTNKPKNIIVMKVGPHSNMSLDDIVKSKIDEEKIHGVHYWGYSGVFCHPSKVQEFCENVKKETEGIIKLILIETKSTYESSIGFIKYFSKDNINFEKFSKPVQLQGAQFSFVSRKLKKIDNFNLEDYIVVGGKNNGIPLNQHLKYRVNKSFAQLNTDIEKHCSSNNIEVYEAELVYPYAIWLKD